MLFSSPADISMDSQLDITFFIYFQYSFLVLIKFSVKDRHLMNILLLLLSLFALLRPSQPYSINGKWKLRTSEIPALETIRSTITFDFQQTINQRSGQISRTLMITTCRVLTYTFEVQDEQIYLDYLSTESRALRTCANMQIEQIRTQMDITFSFFILQNLMILKSPLNENSFYKLDRITSSALFLSQSMHGTWKIIETISNSTKNIPTVIINPNVYSICNGGTNFNYTIRKGRQIQLNLKDKVSCNAQFLNAVNKIEVFRINNLEQPKSISYYDQNSTLVLKISYINATNLVLPIANTASIVSNIVSSSNATVNVNNNLTNRTTTNNTNRNMSTNISLNIAIRTNVSLNSTISNTSNSSQASNVSRIVSTNTSNIVVNASSNTTLTNVSNINNQTNLSSQSNRTNLSSQSNLTKSSNNSQTMSNQILIPNNKTSTSNNNTSQLQVNPITNNTSINPKTIPILNTSTNTTSTTATANITNNTSQPVNQTLFPITQIKSIRQIAGKWQISQINTNSIPKEALDRYELVINNVRFLLSGGCNTIFSSYKQSNGKISFQRISQTQNKCQKSYDGIIRPLLFNSNNTYFITGPSNAEIRISNTTILTLRR